MAHRCSHWDTYIPPFKSSCCKSNKDRSPVDKIYQFESQDLDSGISKNEMTSFEIVVEIPRNLVALRVLKKLSYLTVASVSLNDIVSCLTRPFCIGLPLLGCPEEPPPSSASGNVIYLLRSHSLSTFVDTEPRKAGNRPHPFNHFPQYTMGSVACVPNKIFTIMASSNAYLTRVNAEGYYHLWS